MGMVTAGRRVSMIGYQQVTAPLGSALAFASNGNLALIAYDLYEFKTRLDRAAGAAASANPQRLASLRERRERPPAGPA